MEGGGEGGARVPRLSLERVAQGTPRPAAAAEQEGPRWKDTAVWPLTERLRFMEAWPAPGPSPHLPGPAGGQRPPEPQQPRRSPVRPSKGGAPASARAPAVLLQPAVAQVAPIETPGAPPAHVPSPLRTSAWRRGAAESGARRSLPVGGWAKSPRFPELRRSGSGSARPGEGVPEPVRVSERRGHSQGSWPHSPRPPLFPEEIAAERLPARGTADVQVRCDVVGVPDELIPGSARAPRQESPPAPSSARTARSLALEEHADAVRHAVGLCVNELSARYRELIRRDLARAPALSQAPLPDEPVALETQRLQEDVRRAQRRLLVASEQMAELRVQSEAAREAARATNALRLESRQQATLLARAVREQEDRLRAAEERAAGGNWAEALRLLAGPSAAEPFCPLPEPGPHGAPSPPEEESGAANLLVGGPAPDADGRDPVPVPGLAFEGAQRGADDADDAGRSLLDGAPSLHPEPGLAPAEEESRAARVLVGGPAADADGSDPVPVPGLAFEGAQRGADETRTRSASRLGHSGRDDCEPVPPNPLETAGTKSRGGSPLSSSYSSSSSSSPCSASPLQQRHQQPSGPAGDGPGPSQQERAPSGLARLVVGDSVVEPTERESHPPAGDAPERAPDPHVPAAVVAGGGVDAAEIRSSSGEKTRRAQAGGVDDASSPGNAYGNDLVGCADGGPAAPGNMPSICADATSPCNAATEPASVLPGRRSKRSARGREHKRRRRRVRAEDAASGAGGQNLLPPEAAEAADVRVDQGPREQQAPEGEPEEETGTREAEALAEAAAERARVQELEEQEYRERLASRKREKEAELAALVELDAEERKAVAAEQELARQRAAADEARSAWEAEYKQLRAELQQLEDDRVAIVQGTEEEKVVTMGAKQRLAAAADIEAGLADELREANVEVGLLCSKELKDAANRRHVLDAFFRTVTSLARKCRTIESHLHVDSACSRCYDTLRAPRALWPCGHTFCTDCVAEMAASNEGHLECSECLQASRSSVAASGYTYPFSDPAFRDEPVFRTTPNNALASVVRSFAEHGDLIRHLGRMIDRFCAEGRVWAADQ